MKLYVYFFVVLLAMTAPCQGLLGVKLALLGALRNGFGGGDNILGNGNGGGYGNGGYVNGMSYSRPVYTGLSSNYGWGQRSYGGGYNSVFNAGYRSGYNGGNEESVKVIKVIVNHEQPQGFYDNYARSSAASASAVSTSSDSSWTPVQAPTPSVETYAVQPIPVQVVQPPPRPVYVQSQYSQQPQPVYQQVAAQRPIQYSAQQPIYQQSHSIYHHQQQQPQAQQTIRVIVDGDSHHAPAQTYGPPTPALSYVPPSVDNAGAFSSDSSASSSSVSGSNNVGTGPWKSGSIWESVGC